MGALHLEVEAVCGAVPGRGRFRGKGAGLAVQREAPQVVHKVEGGFVAVVGALHELGLDVYPVDVVVCVSLCRKVPKVMHSSGAFKGDSGHQDVSKDIVAFRHKEV